LSYLEDLPLIDKRLNSSTLRPKKPLERGGVTLMMKRFDIVCV